MILTSPIISSEESFTRITLEDATSTLRVTGEPMVPKITKTFILPLGTQVTDTIVQESSDNTQYLQAKVLPSAEPVIDGDTIHKERTLKASIYETNALYPSQPYTTHQKVGLHEGEHVIFHTVHYYPIRYNPVENVIIYSNKVDIQIEYLLPTDETIIQTTDNQDLLVIYPELFSEEIQPFIDHKNDFNMNAYGKTLEDIYAEQTQGVDDQEKIKLAIKDAIETEGISYVLLVGGHKGQSDNWYVPVRYGHSQSEDAYASDLYYSDIYKIVDTQPVFDDWDSNDNGKFAEYGNFIKDEIDGAPDVYIGRLACRSEKEVTTVVNKIITYEETKAAESWFKHMLLIGGDTYPYDGNYDGCEAEIDTDLSASYMDGFTFTRLWASTGALTGQSVVEDAINDGAGLIHMAGHANPSCLVTHPPHNEETITILQMYDIGDPLNMNPKLDNKDMLPVILIGGCHNSQFNVSLMNIIKGIMEYGIKGMFLESPYKFYYMEWVPKCFSWWLTSNPNGGAIATMGNTGLGMGIGGQDYVTGLDGWLFPRFFYHYGQDGQEFIGMAHSSAITDYVNEFDINSDGEDRQMIQQWALLGDPSLMIGGYDN